MRKVIFLILAFLLPVGIFLFLKIFGKNKFNVEPLFQENIQPSMRCEGINYKIPYIVPDSVWRKLAIPEDAELVVANFEQEVLPTTSAQLNRIREEFNVDGVVIKERPSEVISEQSQKCTLFISQDSAIMLLDKAQRIRGYYKGSSLDDMDRLIVEMKIILEK